MLPVAAPPIAGGAVVARGERIVDVGPAEVVLERHAAAPVRDLGGHILLPGLVDAHCHLEWSLLDGLLPEAPFADWLGGMLELRERMAPEDHAAAARWGALRALRAGTTTLADAGPTGAGVRAMAEAGLRGIVHLEVFGAPEGDAARAAAAALAERRGRLRGAGAPGVRVGVSPHAPYSAGPGLWAALADDASLAGAPWTTHLSESDAEAAAIADGGGALAEALGRAGFAPARWAGAAGASPVARLGAAGALRPGLVAAHCAHVDAADAALLAARAVAVAHCPRSNAHLRCGPAPLHLLRRAGVTVGLGTDSPASGGDYDLRAEARACAAVHARSGAPVAPGDLVRLATLGAAEALGLADEAGAIAPGRRADLVAVLPGPDADPAADPAACALAPDAPVTDVVAGGVPVLERGRPTRLDARSVDAAAAEARRRLC